MVKVVLVGRGSPTSKQLSLLAKALNTEAKKIEIIATIEQLQNPQQLQQYPADAIFSFVLHPTVIDILSKVHKQTGIPYFIPQTEAIKTAEVNSREEAEKLAEESSADIVNLKVLPNGTISARLLRTKALLKNPVLELKAEEIIQ